MTAGGTSAGRGSSAAGLKGDTTVPVLVIAGAVNGETAVGAEVFAGEVDELAGVKELVFGAGVGVAGAEYLGAGVEGAGVNDGEAAPVSVGGLKTDELAAGAVAALPGGAEKKLGTGALGGSAPAVPTPVPIRACNNFNSLS